MADRWVPVLGYMLAKIEGHYFILQHGGRYVGANVPNNEILLRSIAEVADYDRAVDIIRALRAALDDGQSTK